MSNRIIEKYFEKQANREPTLDDMDNIMLMLNMGDSSYISSMMIDNIAPHLLVFLASNSIGGGSRNKMEKMFAKKFGRMLDDYGDFLQELYENRRK